MYNFDTDNYICPYHRQIVTMDFRELLLCPFREECLEYPDASERESVFQLTGSEASDMADIFSRISSIHCPFNTNYQLTSTLNTCSSFLNNLYFFQVKFPVTQHETSTISLYCCIRKECVRFIILSSLIYQ